MELMTGFGLATAAGLNAYIPLLAMGLLGRFTHLVTLPHGWAWLQNGWVIAIVAVLLVIEIVADKIPALDSTNDAVQTFVRPTAGGIVFGSGTASQTAAVTDPGEFARTGQWVPIAIGVVTALVVHLTKTAVRPAANVATAGVAAPVLSTIERHQRRAGFRRDSDPGAGVGDPHRPGLGRGLAAAARATQEARRVLLGLDPPTSRIEEKQPLESQPKPWAATPQQDPSSRDRQAEWHSPVYRQQRRLNRSLQQPIRRRLVCAVRQRGYIGTSRSTCRRGTVSTGGVTRQGTADSEVDNQIHGRVVHPVTRFRPFGGIPGAPRGAVHPDLHLILLPVDPVFVESKRQVLGVALGTQVAARVTGLVVVQVDVIVGWGR